MTSDAISAWSALAFVAVPKPDVVFVLRALL
jgi:hypothetical protein